MIDGLRQILKSKKIVGYYEIIDALENSTPIDDAIILIKQHSRNYAKRQLTWFRNKAQVHWINPVEQNFEDEMTTNIRQFLGKMS